MPPKAKFTKEEIIEAALSIVRVKGFPDLTARSLGDALGSSTRPVFTVFQGMEEVQRDVIRAARQVYNGYIQNALSGQHAYKQQFKSVGAQYILFSIKEPKLFQLLFMREQNNLPDFTGILPLIDENYESILLSIRNDYGFDYETSQKLYQHLWIYTHGIASLCATGMCRFTGQEIAEMMTEVCSALLSRFTPE